MSGGLRSLARRHGLALGGFAAATTVLHWGGVRHLFTRLMVTDGDAAGFLWAYWAVPRAALRLENPFVTDLLFHPVGADLAFHTTTPLEMALSWPVARLFGLGVAANLLVLAAAFLSAVGAYLLALHVCGDRRAAFFAGVAFAFVPYRFVHGSGHLNLIHAQFLPFGLLAALRLLEQPTRWRAVVLGLVLGLTLLTDFYLLVFLALGVAVLVLLWRPDGRPALAVPWRRLAEVALVAALVSLPILAPSVRAVASGQLDPVPGWGGADRRSADLLSWVLPWERHPVWGSLVDEARRGLPARGEGVAYPGLVVLGLAVVGRELAGRERRRGWVALAATAGVLALGPFLQVGGRSGGLFSHLGRDFVLPLPFFVVHWVPVLDGMRVPGRFAILAILALDVLAALALAALFRLRHRWAPVMAAGAVAVLLLEFLPGAVRTAPDHVPDPYRAIAADADPGAVLEIPLQWQSGFFAVGDTSPPRDDTVFLYYATVHERPVASGHVARYPAERLRRLAAIPVYRQVLALTGEPGFGEPPTFDAADLRALGIGFVVYHRDRPEPAAFAYLDGLGLERLADDGQVLVWKVGP